MSLPAQRALPRYVLSTTYGCLHGDRFQTQALQVIWRGLHIQLSRSASKLKAICGELTWDVWPCPHGVLVEIHRCVHASGLFIIFLGCTRELMLVQRQSLDSEEAECVNVCAAKADFLDCPFNLTWLQPQWVFGMTDVGCLTAKDHCPLMHAEAAELRRAAMRLVKQVRREAQSVGAFA